MDDRARAIFDHARATLERVADVTVEHRDHGVDYWQRPTPEPEVHDNIMHHQKLTDAEEQRYIDGRIADAINRRAEITQEVVAQALAHERKLHRAEIAKLDLRLSALLAEVTKKQAVADGAVVELPAFVERRRHARS